MPQSPTVTLPQRWPLVTMADNRSNSFSKDARLFNAVAEKDDLTGEYHVEKRACYASGVAQYAPAANGSGWGVYSTTHGINVWSVFGILGSSMQFYLGTTLKSSGLDFTQADGYFFEEAGLNLVFGNGVKGYYTLISGGAINTITDLDFPTLFVRGFVYLNGTTYVMDAQGNIFGSDFGSLSAWSATNVIKADTISGSGICLIRHMAYVVAMMEYGTQVFLDNGNPVPGSPLAKVQEAFIPYGCFSANTVQAVDGSHFWLGTNKNVSPQVILLKNLQATVVSSPAIDRLLSTVLPSHTMRSFAYKLGGHSFYGITIVDLNVTLVYDISENLWYQWGNDNGDYWPIVGTTNSASGTVIGQRYNSNGSNGGLVIFNADYLTSQDDGITFPVDIYTPNFDAGTRRGKVLSVMRLLADQYPGSMLYVRYSDDDYQTWTNFRQIDLSTIDPVLDNEGTFKRRAYHFRHFAATPFRMTAAELQMDLCTL